MFNQYQRCLLKVSNKHSDQQQTTLKPPINNCRKLYNFEFYAIENADKLICAKDSQVVYSKYSFLDKQLQNCLFNLQV